MKLKKRFLNILILSTFLIFMSIPFFNDWWKVNVQIVIPSVDHWGISMVPAIADSALYWKEYSFWMEEVLQLWSNILSL